MNMIDFFSTMRVSPEIALHKSLKTKYENVIAELQKYVYMYICAF